MICIKFSGNVPSSKLQVVTPFGAENPYHLLRAAPQIHFSCFQPLSFRSSPLFTKRYPPDFYWMFPVFIFERAYAKILKIVVTFRVRRKIWKFYLVVQKNASWHPSKTANEHGPSIPLNGTTQHFPNSQGGTPKVPRCPKYLGKTNFSNKILPRR